MEWYLDTLAMAQRVVSNRMQRAHLSFKIDRCDCRYFRYAGFRWRIEDARADPANPMVPRSLRGKEAAQFQLLCSKLNIQDCHESKFF